MPNTIYIDVITISNKIDNALFTTLNNVSKQSYKAINHIIIYRQAADNEIERLQNFDSQKNLSYYSQKGKGIASAFNNGIDHSKGEIILFLNAGDTLVNNNVIHRVMESYAGEKWLWATGETISVSKNRYLQNHRPQHKTWDSNLFLYGNPVCHQSTFYSRNLIDLVGKYNESLSIEMDYEYNVRANLLSSPTLLYFPIAYYDTTGVSSVRVFRQFNNHRRIRDRYFSLSKPNRLKVDTYCLLKSIFRLAMVPAKLWL
ncbi:glycosyltransferase [Waterburya agarophytonicola K14]|uniref:Glycosyltransferase n=1 Tax=Waterburya agarophytonicola KI4 TaxID=2874699 RepID=A0A964FHP8_9CYAN|nr:glycosyltransferase [Waterburya agarophytonicola]MCC0179336.1 glycosyltransferase [Waterburya agarophytonicola KI4]